MEKDRYAHFKKLYIISMISFLLGLILIGLSLYCLPHLLWKWLYDVPSFITHWMVEMQEVNQLTRTNAALVIFAQLFLPGVILLFISLYIANYMDRQLLREDISVPSEMNKTKGDALVSEGMVHSLSLTSKIFLIMITVLAILFGIEWLITVPAPI